MNVSNEEITKEGRNYADKHYGSSLKGRAQSFVDGAKWMQEKHEKELADLRADYGKLYTHCDNLRDKLAESEAERDKLKEEMKGLEFDLRTCQDKEEYWHLNYDKTEKERGTLEADNERLKEESNALRNKVIDEVKKRTDPLRGFLTHTELDEILESLKRLTH